MTSKTALRLKLTDFINTDIEKYVMEKVNDIHNELQIAILLYLWFDEDDLKGNELRDFLMRWENEMSFKTIVKQGSKTKPDDFVFFDIKPNSVKNKHARFSYSYKTSSGLLTGLKEFYNVTKFVTSDKTIKKQKRNDYED
jgi:hypothetical protein